MIYGQVWQAIFISEKEVNIYGFKHSPKFRGSISGIRKSKLGVWSTFDIKLVCLIHMRKA